MKTKISLLFLFSIPLFLSAQKALEPLSRSALHLKGNVSKVTELHYAYDEDGNMKKKPFTTIVYHFNDRGQLIKKEKRSESEFFYDDDIYHYTYDKSGKLTSILSNTEKEYYTYSIDGKKLTRISTGTYNERDVYEMDEKGRIKEWSNYSVKDGNINSRRKFFFNPNSSLKQVYYEGSGYSYLFTYNGYGDVTGNTMYDKKNNWLEHETFQYEHDRHSNWTICRQNGKDNDGTSYRTTIYRTYVYGSGKPSAYEAEVYTAYVGFDPIPKDEVYYNKGEDYYYGRGVVQSYSEAARWYKVAAGEGNVQAMKDLGYLYRSGKNGAADLEESYRWYRDAADKGDAYAMMRVGICYEEGEGVQRDYAEAMRWYKKSATAGEAKSKLYIGLLYKNGKGVPASKTEARKWISESASAGVADAKTALENL